MSPAGIVYNDVELRPGGPHQLGPVLRPSDVGLHERAADLPRDALAGARVDVVHHDPRALLGKTPRDAGAEARAGARHDCELAFQTHFVLRYFLNGLCSHNSFT